MTQQPVCDGWLPCDCTAVAYEKGGNRFFYNVGLPDYPSANVVAAVKRLHLKPLYAVRVRIKRRAR